MAALKSAKYNRRINASVSKDELDQFNELCKLEGRSHRAQIMFMTRRRLVELKREAEYAK